MQRQCGGHPGGCGHEGALYFADDIMLLFCSRVLRSGCWERVAAAVWDRWASLLAAYSQATRAAQQLPSELCLLLWVPFIVARCTHRCHSWQVKFIYDHVFEPRTDNRMVYKTVASPIVQSALDGINGTVFACEGPLLRFTLSLQRVCGRSRHHDALPGRRPMP